MSRPSCSYSHAHALKLASYIGITQKQNKLYKCSKILGLRHLHAPLMLSSFTRLHACIFIQANNIHMHVFVLLTLLYIIHRYPSTYAYWDSRSKG